MRKLLRAIGRLFHFGEDAHFAATILESVGLRPRDFMIGGISGLIALVWRSFEGAGWLGRIVYWLAVLAIWLAVIAVGRVALGRFTNKKSQLGTAEEPQRDDLPDLRVADNSRVASLFESDERDKLFPLLEANKLTAWARPMKGNDALTSIPG